MPKKEDDNFLGGCVSSGILHARMLHFVEQLGNTSFDLKYATWLIVEHILVSRNILVAIWWRPHLGTSAPCPGSGSRSRLTTRITSLFHRNRIFPVPSLASNSLQRHKQSTFLLFFFSTNHPRPSPSNHSIHFPPSSQL